PDVAASSKFIYRLLPFYGTPSAEVEVTTGKAPPPLKILEEEGPLPPLTNEEKSVRQSLRNAATFASVVPEKPSARLASPTSVELRWKDCATDEDGYLVEVAARGDREFKICALLPPNTTSFKKTLLPPESKCRFRVRAFFYGPPSARAEIQTASSTK